MFKAAHEEFSVRDSLNVILSEKRGDIINQETRKEIQQYLKI